ncbi:MAG: hypothetical protein AAGD33_02955 [Actinomycetota bacterium]
MASWLVERRLSKTAGRLRTLRSELAVIDEQLRHLDDDADDQELRAMVAETSAAVRDARQARGHVDAMRRHRERVVVEIETLEQRQDELLARLSSSGPAGG